MNYRSETIKCSSAREAFTFIEVIVAIVILGLITSSVLVVLNRSIEAVIDSRLRMQAFELARWNMEKLLASDSVTDMAEFGLHERNEDIEWETVIEAFDEPVKAKMWIRAVCSASFMDRYGERQRIEMTHWLTQVTALQEKQIRDQRRRQQQLLDQAEGNPFGNTPDGLMLYGQALVSMGDYAKAAEAFARILLQYPDSELVDLALKKILAVIEALAKTDPDTANYIVPQLVRLFPDELDIQSLPEKLIKWTRNSFMPDSTDFDITPTPDDEDGSTPGDEDGSTPGDEDGSTPYAGEGSLDD